jgi:hypothetical protein
MASAGKPARRSSSAAAALRSLHKLQQLARADRFPAGRVPGDHPAAGDLQIDGFKRSYLALAGVDLGNTCERNHPFIR